MHTVGEGPAAPPSSTLQSHWSTRRSSRHWPKHDDARHRSKSGPAPRGKLSCEATPRPSGASPYPGTTVDSVLQSESTGQIYIGQTNHLHARLQEHNAAERALRAIAVGRKNWLFVGSNRGGRRAAVLYSLIATCKRHAIDPFAYLRDVLERVATHPSSGIAVLLPPNWKAGHEVLKAGAPTEPAPSTPSPVTA